MSLYLIHFDRPFKHARHYLGFVESMDALPARLARHAAGDGARLLRAVKAAGIGWRVVRTWPEGDRKAERRLKGTRCVPDYCPVCREARNRAAREARAASAAGR